MSPILVAIISDDSIESISVLILGNTVNLILTLQMLYYARVECNSKLFIF